MTHIENIPHILSCGIVRKDSSNANPNYISIGDISLIDTRAKKSVNISNGNRSVRLKSVVLGDFIPFYFGIRMPMLYVAQHGGNYVEKATPPQDIVYTACNLNSIIQYGINFYFSDGHATDAFTLFYDSTKVTELSTIINWSAIKSSYWGGEDNLEVKRQKQAEFLSASDIPANLLHGFFCYNETAKQRLMEMGVDGEKIKNRPQDYF
jgi:hypothetical protein